VAKDERKDTPKSDFANADALAKVAKREIAEGLAKLRNRLPPWDPQEAQRQAEEARKLGKLLDDAISGRALAREITPKLSRQHKETPRAPAELEAPSGPAEKATKQLVVDELGKMTINEIPDTPSDLARLLQKRLQPIRVVSWKHLRNELRPKKWGLWPVPPKLLKKS